MWLDSKAVNCPQKWGNFKEGIQEVLDLVLVVIDTFVDHLENTRGKRIRD